MVAHKNSSGKPKGLGALYGDGHTVFNTNQELFEEELWGDSYPNIPDTRLDLWFPILSRLGNNVPDPLVYGDDPDSTLWTTTAAKCQCNENRKDGTSLMYSNYQWPK